MKIKFKISNTTSTLSSGTKTIVNIGMKIYFGYMTIEFKKLYDEKCKLVINKDFRYGYSFDTHSIEKFIIRFTSSNFKFNDIVYNHPGHNIRSNRLSALYESGRIDYFKFREWLGRSVGNQLFFNKLKKYRIK